MIERFKAFLANETGSSGVEYGLLVVFFVAIVTAVAQFFGDTLSSVNADVTSVLTVAAKEN